MCRIVNHHLVLSRFYPRLTLNEKMDQINKLKDHINVCMMKVFHPVLNIIIKNNSSFQSSVEK